MSHKSSIKVTRNGWAWASQPHSVIGRKMQSACPHISQIQWWISESNSSTGCQLHSRQIESWVRSEKHISKMPQTVSLYSAQATFLSASPMTVLGSYSSQKMHINKWIVWKKKMDVYISCCIFPHINLLLSAAGNLALKSNDLRRCPNPHSNITEGQVKTFKGTIFQWTREVPL